MLPRRERVQFAGSQGHPIAGRLDRPAEEPLAYAILAHCFTCTKDLKPFTWITRELVDRRIGVLRFDFTGLGESGGDFADTNFTSNLADLVRAADFLRERYGPPAMLVGHSLGGTAVLATAGQIPDARVVATIAAPSGTAHIKEFVTRQVGELPPDRAAQIDVMGRPVRIKGQLVADLARHDVLQDVRRLGRPLVVFHSPDDNVVDIVHAERIFAAAGHPKSFVALPGADHLLLERDDDARFVAEVLATWARRYAANGE